MPMALAIVTLDGRALLSLVHQYEAICSRMLMSSGSSPSAFCRSKMTFGSTVHPAFIKAGVHFRSLTLSLSASPFSNAVVSAMPVSILSPEMVGSAALRSASDISARTNENQIDGGDRRVRALG